MTGGWVPTEYATVAGCCCPSVRSCRLGWLADGGTELAATTYPPTTAEPPDTEYELAFGRLAGLLPLYDPNFPRQNRHQADKREAPRPGKRLKQLLAKRNMRRILRRTLSTGAMQEENKHRYRTFIA
jgi:hypothetical protein